MKIFAKYLFVLSIAFSCTNKSAEQSPPENNPLSKNKNECKLLIDTFSFKGIKIGENISTVSKKYKFTNPKKNKIEYQEYDSITSIWVDVSGGLTIFGYTISAVNIQTYKDIMYSINIKLKDENTFALLGDNVTDIVEKFAIKFTEGSCIKNDPLLMVERPRRIYVSNSKLSVSVSSGVQQPIKYGQEKNWDKPHLFCDIQITSVPIEKRLQRIRDVKTFRKRKKNDHDI
jgi:hypothetical protein